MGNWNAELKKVPKITDERPMTLDEAVAWSLDGQTRLIDAEVRICIWESERIVKQARVSTTWETHFHRSLTAVQKAWAERATPSGRAES